jgi:hypothetical protein
MFCIFAVAIEATKKSKLNLELGSERWSDLFSRRYPINALNNTLTSRLVSVEDQAIETEIQFCGFSPDQVSFIWKWVKGEISLIQKKKNKKSHKGSTRR